MSAAFAQDNHASPGYLSLFGYRVAAKPLFAVAIATALAASVAHSSATTSDSNSHQATVAPSHDVDAHPARAQGVAPMNFEANRGQWGPSIRYAARGQHYSVAFGVQETLIHAEDSNATAALRFRGGNTAPAQEALQVAAKKTEHLHDSERSRWISGTDSSGKLAYHNVYPGIDAVFYANQQALEYELTVAPGANPALIALEFRGTDSVELSARGDLAIHFSGTTLTQQAPVIYQNIGGERRGVQGRYITRDDHSIGLALSDYDPTQPLYIASAISYLEHTQASH